MLADVPQRAKTHLPLVHETSEFLSTLKPNSPIYAHDLPSGVKADLTSLGILVPGRRQLWEICGMEKAGD